VRPTPSSAVRAFEQELRTAFQEVLRGKPRNSQNSPRHLWYSVRGTRATPPRRCPGCCRLPSARSTFSITHGRQTSSSRWTIDLAKLDILPGADSKDGFANALASRAPGGVQLGANGSIRRDATISLAALRRLAVLEADGTLSVDRTKALRTVHPRSVASRAHSSTRSLLRQGCNLVPDVDKPREFKLVNLDGTRPDYVLPQRGSNQVRTRGHEDVRYRHFER